MKKFIYVDMATSEILFETVEQNCINFDSIDEKMENITGRDPSDKMIKRFISSTDIETPSIGRYDKNRRM